ncbi:hypothetical protein J5N97_026382 [Dioscorea zingiberensis]|uniref:Disease resistance protein n=1 Tax=Dioscorea zingiberensis TaxID=325984 RepID=A0A9D5C345_9LILI|nr:hypothetical protein J5N97_026382 [Dioscorea zingiberensis]
MADSIVSFVVAKLGDLIAQEIVFLQEVADRLRSLRDEFQWMQAFLKDADGSIKRGNERAKLWVSQVRDVAYDAEDIIDTYIYKIHQQRRRSSTLTNCITSTSQLTILHELGNQIANVKKRAEEISANRSKYGIESVGGTSSDISIITTTTMSFNRKQNHLDVEEADVVGFDKHVKTLVKLLITAEDQGPHQRQQLAVISIVGMGGLGKSTLAKKVCSNPDVKRHFNCQALVYVSQAFKTREILERIAKCAMAMSEKKMKELSQEKLKEEICEYLKERRYLVVLDDVWTRDAWDMIKDVLPEVINGSRVLLTTRNSDVGVYADRQSPLFKLQNLGEDESWDLFCKKAIHPTNSMEKYCPSHLESIGKEMVAKCGGLPLAIVVLGGLVSRKEQTVVEWRKVLKSLKWQLQEGEDQISPILDLSYHHLPYYLKPCFLYFAIFPEDEIIDPNSLIRLWIAEGFVQARGEETLEEVAEDYLQELVQRSMIQVAMEANYFRDGVVYQIHDLILDLSISQAKVDNFLHVPKNSKEENSLHKTRRLALNGNEMNSYIAAGKYSTNSSQSLRTITCMDMKVRTSKMLGFLHDMKLLRVLNLHGTFIKKLPSDIGKLIHLRYLGLRWTIIKTLPSSIAELTNLQTLILVRSSINVLPRGLWKMGNNLRHLEGYIFSIKGTPSVESLPNLQTLSSVKVGPWLLNGLGKMTSLRKLSILEVTDTYAEPLLDCLGKLNNLNYLSWKASFDGIVPSSLLSTSQSHLRRHLQLQEVSLTGRIVGLPESNRMNACITKLSLILSKLEEDPLVTLGKLGNLQFLDLIDAFVGEEIVCLERGFPQLKELALRRFDSLERWKIEDQAMPKLRHLFLSNCQKLVMLPDGLERITSLQELTVVNMPDSFNQRLRVDEGEDWGVIRHIPSVTITMRSLGLFIEDQEKHQ